jgi:hypothetical protein
MTSEPSFQLPQRATDPHEFPATRDDWHSYRRWLAQYGGKLGEQLSSAPTFPEREAARREWEAVADLTGRAEEAYERFQIAQEDAEYADFARTLANRIHADWVSPNSIRPARDASREALTSIAYNEGEEGLTAGHPVGLDQKGRELSALMEKLDTPEGSPVMRLPRANVLALTLVLEEFAARLMLARQKGELTEGDAYIQAVVELQADLESRRYGE